MSLLTKKEQLQAELEKIEGQIAALFEDGGSPAAAPRGRVARSSSNSSSVKAKAPAKPAGRGPNKKKGRGALKSGILAALKAAGAEGVSIKDLVSKLGSKSSNLHAWFNVTGKKMGNIKKIGRGVYRLEE